MNLETFFNEVRPIFPGKRLKEEHVENIKIIIDTFQREYPESPDSCLAYLLATALHETAHRMEPIKEYGGNRRANNLYGVEGKNPSRARKMGNTKRGDGARYMGRGYVQLTWKNNYKKVGDQAGIDLVSNPAKALDPDIAAMALVYGCMEGIYTGKALPDYITSEKADFRNARRVVNGMDKSSLIAGYAEDFNEALEAAGGVKQISTDTQIIVDGEEVLPKENRKPISNSRTLQGLVLTFLSGIGGFVLETWDSIKTLIETAKDPLTTIQSLFGSIQFNGTTMFVFLGLIGLVLTAYARLDANARGKEG